jgi:tetratricopeptide (TPR) repeat protein
VKGYTTKEVAEALGLPTSRILAWTRSGLIEPVRGPRGAHVYSFQDLVLLRTARGLLESDVPARRVRESLAALREQLPAGRPLSAVTISAIGSSGQLQINFPEPTGPESAVGSKMATATPLPEVEPPFPPLSIHRDRQTLAEATPSADDWYDAAVDLESSDVEAAMSAYRHAIELDNGFSDALLNLGRLLHERGEADEAEAHYLRAIASGPENARAHFNMGVALEDRGAPDEALDAYLESLRIDPDLAVAHYNVSRLREEAGDSTGAIHHLSEYRRLMSAVEVS